MIENDGFYLTQKWLKVASSAVGQPPMLGVKDKDPKLLAANAFSGY